jgi:hypothetical protein
MVLCERKQEYIRLALEKSKGGGIVSWTLKLGGEVCFVDKRL